MRASLSQSFALQIAKEISDQQDDQYKTEPAPAASRTAIRIAATTSEKNEDDDKNNECHEFL
jgi:hypothetical protein